MPRFLHQARLAIFVTAVVLLTGVRSAESADKSAAQAHSILKKYWVGGHGAKDAEGG